MRTILTALTLFCVIALNTGCSSLFESTKSKQIGFDSTVYGFKVVFSDPGTGSMFPTGEFGFGSLSYRSVPIEAGQPYYARYTIKSIWSRAPASDTIIWVGRASQRGMLTFEAVPEGMIRVGADGVTTDSATLEVKPIVVGPVK